MHVTSGSLHSYSMHAHAAVVLDLSTCHFCSTRNTKPAQQQWRDNSLQLAPLALPAAATNPFPNTYGQVPHRRRSCSPPCRCVSALATVCACACSCSCTCALCLHLRPLSASPSAPAPTFASASCLRGGWCVCCVSRAVLILIATAAAFQGRHTLSCCRLHCRLLSPAVPPAASTSAAGCPVMWLRRLPAPSAP